MTDLRLTPLTTSIAAKVDGVDLRAPITESVAMRLRDALSAHSVLVFGDQHVGLEEQKALAQVWGSLEPLPPLKFLGIDEASFTFEAQNPEALAKARSGSAPGGRNPGLVTEATRREVARGLRSEFQNWHTDSSFTTELPHVGVLRPEVVTPVGGATSWSGMGAAYDALSPRMQAWLETLKAAHLIPPGYREVVGVDKRPQEVQDGFDAKFLGNAHPVVVRHPKSGRKQIFVNPTYTVDVEDLAPRESATLLRFLFEHVARADFVYRHRWAMGDIVVWDELATLHLAPEDFAPHPRRVVRVTAGLISPTPANSALLAA